ncbi:MAG: pyruvate dehydrogenase (acetyl-transferring), homodimeric type, partial [Ornithinimicrobium sp.]
GVAADVWSVTSWTELRRDGLAAEEHAFLHPDEPARTAYVTQKLHDAQGPIVASTDFASEVPDQIRQFVPNRFATLGADGHGFSDTRQAARRWFHIDVHSMAVRALQLLAEEGSVDASKARQAADRYELLDVNAGTTGNAGGEG